MDLIIYLLIIFIIVNCGRSFFRKLKEYRLAKQEGKDGLGVMLFSLIVSGLVFFTLAGILIIVLVFIVLIFTGVMSFM